LEEEKGRSKTNRIVKLQLYRRLLAEIVVFPTS